MFVNMLGLNRNGILSATAFMFIRENLVFYIIGIVFCMPVVRDFNEGLYKDQNSGVMKVWSALYPVLMTIVFIISVSYLASGTYNPFIYFNF